MSKSPYDPVPTTCPVCGADAKERVMDSLDVGVGGGIPMEIELTCSNPECDHYIGYWSHGHLEPGTGIKTEDLRHLFGKPKRPEKPENWGTW